MKCLRFLFFTFNVVLSICGFAVSGSALWLRFDKITENIFSCADTPSIFLKGVYVLIGAGILMILTGFLGCRAVTKESQCMLGTYFLCLLLILVAEVAAGGYSVSNKDKIRQEFKDNYSCLFTKYVKERSSYTKTALIAIHKELNCCATGKVSSTLSSLVPGLCPNDKNIIEAWLKPDMDCNSRIDEIYSQRVYIIAAVGIGFGVMMVAGLVISAMLCGAIRQEANSD
ncbi:CD9 antigen-like [Petromyzon marinus]|uniref:Tetraspanin n=1 Tax=Petromyzon marinus TaxID=7757 RepID=A0AAJ7XJP5_PETMA|nr:CD9 antigen-like [Petromyzon marinus]